MLENNDDPPWLMPNNDGFGAYCVVLTGVVAGCCTLLNNPDVDGFACSDCFCVYASLGFDYYVFCPWLNKPPLVPNPGVIFPVKLNFGTYPCYLDPFYYLAPCDGWPNEVEGVILLNNPDEAGFFYSYLLPAPNKNDDPTGWFGFENNVDSALGVGNNPPYFLSPPENNPPGVEVLGTWGTLPKSPLDAGVIVGVVVVVPNNVVWGFSYFFYYFLEKSPPLVCKNDGCCCCCCCVAYFGFDSVGVILPNNPPLGAVLCCGVDPNNPPPEGWLTCWFVTFPNKPPLTPPPGVDPENNDDPAGLLINNPELGAYYFFTPIFVPNNPDEGVLLDDPPNVKIGLY